MRPIVKTDKRDAQGNPLEFNPYGTAKEELVKEMGSYCAFCEKYNSRSALHVEHINGMECKDANGVQIYKHLENRWDNFLLACVNCNSIKGAKDVAIVEPFLPHQHNLLHYIEVIEGGIIKAKEGIEEPERKRAVAFIDLVGLDRYPGQPRYSDRDDRWDNRLKVYDLASRYFDKYDSQNPTTDVETIVDVAGLSGFFSVWYYRFKGHDEVIRALINGIRVNGKHVHPFKGTHSASFDAADHYATRARP